MTVPHGTAIGAQQCGCPMGLDMRSPDASSTIDVCAGKQIVPQRVWQAAWHSRILLHIFQHPPQPRPADVRKYVDRAVCKLQM